MDDSSFETPPAKRVKLDDSFDEGAATDHGAASATAASGGTTTTVDDEAAKEQEVGISVFVQDSPSVFRGVLKKRYTDFLVNEILPDGTVLHLRELNVKGSTTDSPVAEAESNQTKSGVGSQKISSRVTELLNGSSDTRDDVSGGGTPANAVEPGPANTATLDTELSTSVPEGTDEVSGEDQAKLAEYFSEDVVDRLLKLYDSILKNPGAKSREHPTVSTPFTTDRAERAQIHQDIRRIFSSKVDSSTNADGVLILTASTSKINNNRRQNRGGKAGGGAGTGAGQGRNDNRRGKLSWFDRGGEYVHFNMYKENKDTMEVISFITRQLKTTNRTFQFAGTKDRRAVTVQRVSAYRIDAERLAGMNRSLRYAAVGDFEYRAQGLELGELQGNEFVITLRDCALDGDGDDDSSETASTPRDRAAAIQAYLNAALSSLRANGFLNYYGLQRFGTFATRTDQVGVLLLQSNFRAAVEAILSFSPAALAAPSSDSPTLISQDDRARATALHLFDTTGRVAECLDLLPRKFTAETAIVRHLGRNRGDYLGALLSIQRNLRLMYVHAYQSLVWNRAASERWRLHGPRVAAGDVVLEHEHRDKVGRSSADQAGVDARTTATAAGETGTSGASATTASLVDADGEVVVEPTGADRGVSRADAFERGRCLTPAEAASGLYSIFDVVLPLPGWDVVYPANESGAWYARFMASEEGGRLDPADMRRKQKDFSLSGGYRKLLARIGSGYGVEVHAYAAADASAVGAGTSGSSDMQFVRTDMERLQRDGQGENGEQGRQGRQDGFGSGSGSGTGTGVGADNGADHRDHNEAGDTHMRADAPADPHPHTLVDANTATDTDTSKVPPNDIHNGDHPDDEQGDHSGPPASKIAAVLTFQLGSSQYATMALRELSRGGIRAHKSEFMSGR